MCSPGTSFILGLRGTPRVVFERVRKLLIWFGLRERDFQRVWKILILRGLRVDVIRRKRCLEARRECGRMRPINAEGLADTKVPFFSASYTTYIVSHKLRDVKSDLAVSNTRGARICNERVPRLAHGRVYACPSGRSGLRRESLHPVFSFLAGSEAA